MHEDYEVPYSFNSSNKKEKTTVDPEVEFAYNSDEDSVIQESKSNNAKKHVFTDKFKKPEENKKEKKKVGAGLSHFIKTVSEDKSALQMYC
jgi:hypothetical protein